MPEKIQVRVNGRMVEVPEGTSVAVAALTAAIACRTSSNGEPRTPLCGMGICFECRMVVNGTAHVRSCQVPCTPGMEIRTNE
jgi:predicted molibdopterin-dependent oxidoreductase YjgC